MSTLMFEPLIAPAAWVALALASTGALGWYCWHRPAACPGPRWIFACTLMLTALAAVLFVLLNPTWVETVPPPAGNPLVTVLVDASASMATGDVSAGRTRYQAAVEMATGAADKLGRNYDVRLRTFSAQTSAVGAADLPTLAPDGDLTDLAHAIRESLEEDRPQGQAVLILSDGAHNAPGGVGPVLEAAQTARSLVAPIYTRTLGGEAQLKDLEITAPRSQELAFVGQTVPVTVRVRQRGQVGAQGTIILEHNGEELARKEIAFVPDGVSETQFQVKQARGGLYQYQARLEDFAAETTAANNTASFQVRVVRDPIRVLVLEGKPYWDAKFLLRTLAQDPSLEIDFVVRLTEGRYMQRRLRLVRPPDAAAETPVAEAPSLGNPADDRSTPDETDQRLLREESIDVMTDPTPLVANADTLRGYQVLVLGRDAETFLSPQVVENLRNWIARDGGSLVCFRGSPVASPDQQLSRLLPVRWAPGRESRFRIQVTELGASAGWLAPIAESSQVLEKLPSLSTLAPPSNVKPLAVVLGRSETADETPVLTYQPYGTGRTVAVEGSGMWRWAFLAPEFQQHDSVYGTVWQSLVRWLVSSVGLVPGQDVALRIDRIAYNVGEPVSAVVLRRAAAEEGRVPDVQLIPEEGGAPQAITPTPVGDEPGVYQVYFGKLDAGRYRAELAGDAGKPDATSTAIAFQVRPYFGEQLDVGARPDLMARIAEESGGAVLDTSDASVVAAQFNEHLARTRPERVHRITAWDRWWVLLGVVGMWMVAWSIRRASGLI